MNHQDFLDTCGRTLERFAHRGFFDSFSASQPDAKSQSFRFRWHFNATFQCDARARQRRIDLPILLPNVPARSRMDRAYRQFVAEQCSNDQPAHRKLPTERLKIVNSRQNLGLQLTLPETDSEEQLADNLGKLIAIAHETYKVFLKSGEYDLYIGEQFAIDIDNFW